MAYITVSGAYGRDYKSAKDALADWRAGKDFVIRTFGSDEGRYCSNADFANGPDHVQIRYAADRKICNAQ